MSRTRTTFPREMPTSYDELIELFPLRPIHDDVELANATEMAHRLAIIDEDSLSADQADYLDVLSNEIERYEQKCHPIRVKHLTGLDALKFLVKEHGMSGSALGRILGNRTLGPGILSGDRHLSQANIKALAKYFSVNPGLFMA